MSEVEGQDSPPADTLPDPAACTHEWYDVEGNDFCAKCGVARAPK